MLRLSKLKSKKGYIFTFEAVVAATIALLAFYFAYFTITHNILTFQEEKRDIDAFEKSNLIANMIFRDHEFPSHNNSYTQDYLEFVNRVREKYYTTKDTISGTFDPFSVRDREYPGSIIYNATVYSNVNTTSIVNYRVYNGDNVYIKRKNLLVPIETEYYRSSRISEILYEGEILYIDTQTPSQLKYISISAPTPVYVIFSVNRVPFNINVTNTSTISEFGKVWEIYEPNEIKILNISQDVPINLSIEYAENSTIYVLKLRPVNISCVVPLRN